MKCLQNAWRCCRMGLIKILQCLAFSSNAIYIVGHVLALIGLSLEQDWCRDHPIHSLEYMPLGLTATNVGVKCSILFRYAARGTSY